MPSLRDKTISGIFWSFLQKIGSKGISFVVMILLARLLTPKDFGLIGMLMIFIQISQAIVDGGFNLALIQKKDTDEEDYSSVFYINLIVSIALYLMLFFTAPLIANFYHQPILTSLARMLGLVFIFNAFSFVQEARLTKAINFKTLAIIHIPSTILGGVVGVIMAMMNYDVWSIVAMQLVTRLAYAIQIWFYAKWKPLLAFNKNKTRNLFSFGSRLLISNIINVVYNNIFLVIIGKFYPVSKVGYYQNAFNLIHTPSGTITNVIISVTFPALSSIQEDNERLRVSFKRVMEQAFFWICPIYVLAGVLAVPLFEFVLTPKWLPAAHYFQLLCVVAILGPLNTYNLNIVNVKGRSDLFLKLNLIRRVVTIIGIIIVIPYGINALLIVQAISSVFAFVLFGHYSGRLILYSLREQLQDILPTLLLSIGIGGVVLFINQSLSSLSSIIRLLLGFGVGAGLYWWLAGYFKLPPFIDFKYIIRNKLANYNYFQNRSR